MKNRETILITGAAKRIGRHMALKLAKAGYDIAIHYNHSIDEAYSLQKEIEETGQKAVCFRADLADEDATVSLFETISQNFTTPHIIINNASVFEEDNISKCDKESWEKHLQINLRAPLLLSQALANKLGEKENGHIINIIDQRVLNLTPHFLSYTISKSGLWTLTQSLAMSLAPNIQVNAIGPGPTFPSARQSEADFQSQWRSLPLEKPAHPDDIANAVIFLLNSNSVTGQMISIDGGEHLGWAQTDNSAPPKE